MKQVVIATLALTMAGCTLSFQNMDTHGEASDLVDENLTTSPDVSPSLSIPAK